MIDLNVALGEPIRIEPELISQATELSKTQGHNRVLLIVTATKPCFYKLWGIMQECIRQEVPFCILHSGQHHDDIIGHGLQEFSFTEHLGIDFRLRGDLAVKSAELFIKTKAFVQFCKSHYPEILFVPYVNGDTMTAAILPAAWLFATNRMSIHGEAGLRSMAPTKFAQLNGHEKPADLIARQWDAPWEVVRNEPFPEQYDTFVAGAGCAHHFPPVDLNAQHLLREGYDPRTLHVVGNTVVDVIAAKEAESVSRSVFETYPKLKSGSWLRVDIHRRENLNSRRFHAIISFVEQLVARGHHVAFIELTATGLALDQYGLRARLQELNDEPNFISTPVWKEYAHVIEFLRSEHCRAILTDSGSMQEEMNQLQKPCFTIRFSTDRPETVKSKSNILVPPLCSEQMVELIEYMLNDPKIISIMTNAARLYGTNVSEQIVKTIKDLFELKDPFFAWTTDRLGLYKEEESLDYL